MFLNIKTMPVPKQADSTRTGGLAKILPYFFMLFFFFYRHDF